MNKCKSFLNLKKNSQKEVNSIPWDKLKRNIIQAYKIHKKTYNSFFQSHNFSDKDTLKKKIKKTNLIEKISKIQQIFILKKLIG